MGASSRTRRLHLPLAVPPGVLLAALALIGSFVGLSPSAPSLGVALACVRAQLIGGELRCDEEIVHDLRDLCVAAPARALAAGDAVERGACVCAAYPALGELGLGCSPMLIARMAPEQLAALDQRVDVNLASPAELASLPGIGPKLAERMVAGRPYAAVDDLIEVRGIGPMRLGKLRPRAVCSTGPN